jgi:hypothetical protein
MAYLDAPGRANSHGTAAMVMGIVGLVMAFVPFGYFAAVPLGVLALVFGLVGRSRVKRRIASNNGAAVAGITLAVLAMAVSVWSYQRTLHVVDQAKQDLDQAQRDLDRAAKSLGDATKALATSTPSGTPETAPTALKKTLLETSGNGSKQTEKFTATGDWDVAWTYDCSGQPNGLNVFSIFPQGGGYETPVMVTNGDAKAQDVQHYHNPGTFYLSVTSTCKWTVTVTG